MRTTEQDTTRLLYIALVDARRELEAAEQEGDTMTTTAKYDEVGLLEIAMEQAREQANDPRRTRFV